MNCEKCGQEIENYEEGEIKICNSCVKKLIDKMQFTLENKSVFKRGYNEG